MNQHDTNVGQGMDAVVSGAVQGSDGRSIEVRCVDCNARIPHAEQDALAGHAPHNPRCYPCGSARHAKTRECHRRCVDTCIITGVRECGRS